MPVNTPSPSENRLRLLGIKTVYGVGDPTTAIGSDMGIPTLYINESSKDAFLLTETNPVTWVDVGAVSFGPSVLSILDASAAPPVSPSVEDAYLLDSTTTINAAWVTAGATYDDRVEWSGTAWLVKSPSTGNTVYVEDVTDFYIYDGSDWILLSTSISGLTYVTMSRSPMTTDNSYVVPTVWRNSVTSTLWMLAGGGGAVADWVKIGGNSLGDAQDSCLSIEDGNAAPPTEVAGNRYVITDGGGGVVHADWDGASFNDICTFDGATWVAFTPTEGAFCEIEDVDTVYMFITGWVKLFQHTGAIFGTDAGNANPDATGVVNFVGNGTQGVSTSGATNVVTITVADATTSQKGVGETSTNVEAQAAAALDKFLVPGNLASIFSAPPALGDVTPNTSAFTQIAMSSVAAPAHAAGLLWYDSTTDALSFYNSETEVALQIGEENWIKVRNETGSTITNGQIVYLNGSGSGLPLIVKAIASSETASQVIGIVTHDIENNSNGYVTTFGLVRDVNTAAFSGGDVIYLSSTVAGSVTTTKPNAKTNFVVRIGVIGAVDAANGTFHVNICCGGSLADVNSYTFKKNGFDDPDNEVQISFVNGTRTLEISPQVSTFTYLSEGIAYLKSSAEDIVIDDTEGAHYIYYVGDTLTKSTSWNTDYILKYALVAIIYWDAVNNEQIYLGDEFQHTTEMGGKTHQYLHDTRGFSLEAGAGLTDILADESGDLDSHAEFGNEATIVYDEDAEFNHSARTSTSNIPVYYKTNSEASPYWRVDETDSFGVLTTGTGRAAYNQLTGGNWVQTEVTNLRFVLGHVFTFNDSTRRYGVIQGENEYSTLGNARDGANTEINSIIIDGLIGPEIKFIGTVIYQTSTGYANTVKSRIRETDTGDDYVDLRDFPFTRGGVSGTITDHGALSGLGDDDHTQYFPVDQSRGLDAPLTVPNGGVGVGTLTDHGLLLGSGVGAITPLGVAGNGFIPIGSAGVDPVLALPSGTADQVVVTPGAGTLTFSLPQSIATTSTVQFAKLGIGTATVPHGAVGTALIAIEGANAAATGPFVQFTTASDDYPLLSIVPWQHDAVSIGFDAYNLGAGAWKSSDAGSNFLLAKDTDAFHIYVDEGIAQGDTVIFDEAFGIDKYGHITHPLQPCFLGVSGAVANVTGDGTAYTIVCTEVTDRNADFNHATGIFTAPVTNNYSLMGNASSDGYTGNHDQVELDVITSNRSTYQSGFYAPTGIGFANYFMTAGSAAADMDAADEAYIRLLVNGAGAAKVIDLIHATFSGVMV